MDDLRENNVSFVAELAFKHFETFYNICKLQLTMDEITLSQIVLEQIFIITELRNKLTSTHTIYKQ
jgi:hypothetical protein